jgi:hypothetical protein
MARLNSAAILAVRSGLHGSVLYPALVRSLARVAAPGEDWQRILMVADLGIALVLGLIEDVLPYGLPGFDRINDEEFRQWLMRHGAVEESAWSPPVKAVYDLAFAYAEGDATKPENARIAAGAAVQLIILMTLFYKHAPLWSGGQHGRDDFYTPLPGPREARRYIHFFHRVKRLNLSSDGAFVETISLDRHAEIIRPPYQPLLAAGGLECWPSEPKWEMLCDGEGAASQTHRLRIGLVPLSCRRSHAQPRPRLRPGGARHSTRSSRPIGTGFQSEHCVAGYGRPHKFRRHAGVPAVAFTNTRKPRLVAGAHSDGQFCRAVRLLGRHVSSAGARIVARWQPAYIDRVFLRIDAESAGTPGRGLPLYSRSIASRRSQCESLARRRHRLFVAKGSG